jgi:hypothetical protein
VGRAALRVEEAVRTVRLAAPSAQCAARTTPASSGVRPSSVSVSGCFHSIDKLNLERCIADKELEETKRGPSIALVSLFPLFFCFVFRLFLFFLSP